MRHQGLELILLLISPATTPHLAVTGETLSAQTPALVGRGGDSAAPSPASDHGHYFSYGLVLAHDQARDDILIPLRWMGPAAGLHLGLDFNGERNRHHVSLTPTIAVLDNRFGHKGYAAEIELVYSYARRVANSPRRGNLFLGVQAKWDLYDGFYESWDDEHIYWLNSYSLGPRIVWNNSTGPLSRLSVELDLPVIALVSRPPANRLSKTEQLNRFWFHITQPQKGLTLTGFPKYAALHGGLSYALPLGRARLVFGYDFELSTYSAPARVTTVSNRMSVRHMLRL